MTSTAPRSTDRRVQRTRRALRDALLSLLPERGWDDVSVQDICERADVGRSTFYGHFRDKDDLLLSGFEILHAELDQAMAKAGTEREPNVSDIAQALFRHAEANRRVFRAMWGARSGEIVLRTARKFLKGRIREEVGTMLPGTGNPAVFEAVVEFKANALLSLLSWWLDVESTLSAEELHKLFVTLTRPGVEAALGQSRP